MLGLVGAVSNVPGFVFSMAFTGFLCAYRSCCTHLVDSVKLLDFFKNPEVSSKCFLKKECSFNWSLLESCRFQTEQMECKDKRLRLISEVMNGIKMIKLYGWEKRMKERILEERQKEIRVLRRLAFLNAATSLSWSCAPFVVAGELNGIAAS